MVSELLWQRLLWIFQMIQESAPQSTIYYFTPCIPGVSQVSHVPDSPRRKMKSLSDVGFGERDSTCLLAQVTHRFRDAFIWACSHSLS